MTTDVSSGPIRVLRGGAWQNVDPTLVPTGGTVSPRAVKPLVSFSGGGSAAPLATFADAAGHTVSLRWPGACRPRCCRARARPTRTSYQARIWC